MKLNRIFACFVIITIVAHAVTLKDETKICGVCGQPVHVKVVASAFTAGSMDLDLRPAPEKRNTLKYQIQLCTKCGYCWPDIAKERKREKIAATLNTSLDFSDIAALFARAAEIEIADNAPSFASFMLYLKAAWVMDDIHDIARAKDYRILASKQMELYMARDAVARTTGDYYLLQIDILRRIGDFNKAKALLETAQHYAKESVLPQVFDFQKKLIENKDSDRYTVADALKVAK